jgi:hypothetical protein
VCSATSDSVKGILCFKCGGPLLIQVALSVLNANGVTSQSPDVPMKVNPRLP